MREPEFEYKLLGPRMLCGVGDVSFVRTLQKDYVKSLKFLKGGGGKKERKKKTFAIQLFN